MKENFIPIEANSWRALNTPGAVLTGFFEAISWISLPRIRVFVWAPLLINLLVYVVAFYLGQHYFSVAIAQMLPDWLSFMEWLLWPMFALGFIFLVYFSATLLVNLVGAPFYGLLAEATWERLTGEKPESDASSGWSKQIRNGCVAEWQRFRYFAFRAVPLMLLSFVPGVNLITAPLWLLFTLWFLACEYLAYPLEILGYDFQEQRQILAGWGVGVTTYGGLVGISLMIPIVNLFAAPLAVIAGTLLVGRLTSPVSVD